MVRGIEKQSAFPEDRDTRLDTANRPVVRDAIESVPGDIMENSASSFEFEKDSLAILASAVKKLEAGFAALPPVDGEGLEMSAIENVLSEVAERLKDNYPYFHPLYAGQMLKPPHPVARIAYNLAMWINPNNHALDGGRALEKLEEMVALTCS